MDELGDGRQSPKLVPYAVRRILFAVVGGLTALIGAGYASAFLWATVWTGLAGDPWVELFLWRVCLPIALAALTWVGLWRWTARARPGSRDHP